MQFYSSMCVKNNELQGQRILLNQKAVSSVFTGSAQLPTTVVKSASPAFVNEIGIISLLFNGIHSSQYCSKSTAYFFYRVAKQLHSHFFG